MLELVGRERPAVVGICFVCTALSGKNAVNPPKPVK
jgi:hypothetical protein